MFPDHRRDVSGPQAEGVPADLLQEGGAVLGQAVDEGAGQGGGHLQELIGVEERSHRGVQAGGSTRRAREPSGLGAPGPAGAPRDLQNHPGGPPPDHQAKRLPGHLHQVVWTFCLFGGGGNGDGDFKAGIGGVGDLLEGNQNADQRDCRCSSPPRC